MTLRRDSSHYEETIFYDSIEDAVTAATAFVEYGQLTKPVRGVPNPLTPSKLEKFYLEIPVWEMIERLGEDAPSDLKELLAKEKEAEAKAGEDDTEEEKTPEEKRAEKEAEEKERQARHDALNRRCVGLGVRRLQYSPLVDFIRLDFDPKLPQPIDPRQELPPRKGIHFCVHALNKWGYIDYSKGKRFIGVREFENTADGLERFVESSDMMDKMNAEEIWRGWKEGEH